MATVNKMSEKTNRACEGQTVKRSDGLSQTETLTPCGATR